MLSQGNTSVSEPLYDYYLVEDDLDITVDDQPIDFSKRYSDLNSGSKIVGKKRLRSTTASVSSEPIGCKQPCEDDVRIYCIEGTPLLISSSSSMCDIRDCASFEAGLSRKSLELKERNSLPESSDTPQETSKEETVPKDNEESVVEVNHINEEKRGDSLQSYPLEEMSSELSSPLMFSRSSSVCSLNSSEQHSIIDDRSSVSIFSNLTSGIISPSELPDSPGEAMSPFINKNRQQIFKFPPPESERQSLDDKVNLEKVCDDDAPEDVIKVYDIEGECSSMSSFSELSIHTSSHMSLTYSNECKNTVNIEQRTCIKMDYAANSGQLPKSQVDCIAESGEPSETLPLQFVEKPVFFNQLEESSCSTLEENNYLQTESQSPDKIVNHSITEDIKDSLINEEDADSDFSLIESDGEADALLEECIRSGKTFQNMPDVKKYEIVSSVKKNCKVEDVQSNFDVDKSKSSLVNENENFLERSKRCESEGDTDFSMIENDFKTEHLSEKCATSRKIFEDIHDVKKVEQSLQAKKPYNVEALESCNSLSDSDDEADALLEECIRSGKPDTEKCKRDVKLQPYEAVNLSPTKVVQSSFVRDTSAERKIPVLPKYNVLQRPQKQCEKPKKSTKMCDSSSNKYLKQKSASTSPNSKQKQEWHHGNTMTNAFQCCNSYQGRKCRFEQNLHSFHGMKPYRPEFLQERTSDPMKKLRKEILIGLYRTLNDDKPDKNLKSVKSECDDDDILLNQCIKLGMPDRSPRKHSPNLTQSPSKTTQLHSYHSSPSRINQVFVQSRTGTRPHEFLPSGMHTVKMNQAQFQSRNQYNPSSFNNQSHLRRNQSSHAVKSVPRSISKHIKCSKREEFYNRIEEDYEETENEILQQYIQLGMPTKSRRQSGQAKEMRGNSSFQRFDKNLGYRDNHRPDGISDGEEDDDILMACINAGKPKGKTETKNLRQQSSQNQTPILAPNKLVLQQQKQCNINNKFRCNNTINLGNTHQPPKNRWTSPLVPEHCLVTPVEEAPCVYKTEDTPVLSPTASMSDLSCLSFSEDKSTRSNLNNSRNSDISSESDDDDDELLLQCIQSGMPSAKRAVG